MKIAFDPQIFCAQSYGGVSRYFSILAERLAARNNEVKIFAPLHQNLHISTLPPKLVSGTGWSSYPPRTGRAFLLLNRLLARRAIQKWRPQVVHETYYSRYRSSPESCPTVITVYDMIHELFRDGFARRDRTTMFKRAAVERADHVICISESTRRDLVQLFGTREDKITVVHLGVSHDPFVVSSHRAVTESTRPYLLHVGGRPAYKNFEGLVRAVASSSALKRDFDIVAFGGGKFHSSEDALMNRLGFGKGQVRQVSGDDNLLGHLYSEAAAFVYPSRYEGFGLPPLEAMAHNCPVVCSNTSSMPEIVGDAGEYFDPGSIEDIAAAIERIVYSPTRSKSLVALGKRRLVHFSWDRCADQTLSVYRTLGGV